jgi:glyoxylase-like metal-dependent hydrolase (beta-lactamase superfamily II)
MTDTYEIYAIRYGHHPRKAADNFIGGDPHDVAMPLDYFVWAIVGKSRTILVDTGFIVSHLHYDHSGHYDLFPRARYHLQDREMEYATGRAMCHHQIRHSFEADYVVAMVRKVFAGRVEFHDGDDMIAPGVTVHRIGGHTKGLQSVRVETRVGPVVIAADAAHLYAHLDSGRVFPTVYNVAEVLEGYGRLRKLAASPSHIVPGHDPLVLSRYPAAKPGLEGWIVRLDAEPKG